MVRTGKGPSPRLNRNGVWDPGMVCQAAEMKEACLNAEVCLWQMTVIISLFLNGKFVNCCGIKNSHAVSQMQEIHSMVYFFHLLYSIKRLDLLLMIIFSLIIVSSLPRSISSAAEDSCSQWKQIDSGKYRKMATHISLCWSRRKQNISLSASNKFCGVKKTQIWWSILPKEDPSLSCRTRCYVENPEGKDIIPPPNAEIHADLFTRANRVWCNSRNEWKETKSPTDILEKACKAVHIKL